jgi:hypothetical protein
VRSIERVVLGSCGVVAILLLAGRSVTSATEPPAKQPDSRLHVDGRALEQAVTDAALALVRDHSAAVRAALDRVEQNCRPLQVEDGERYGSEIVVHDQAFHATLLKAREFATKGMLQEGLNEFAWVLRTCRGCHALARSRGLLPQPTHPPRS